MAELITNNNLKDFSNEQILNEYNIRFHRKDNEDILNKYSKLMNSTIIPLIKKEGEDIYCLKNKKKIMPCSVRECVIYRQDKEYSKEEARKILEVFELLRKPFDIKVYPGDSSPNKVISTTSKEYDHRLLNQGLDRGSEEPLMSEEEYLKRKKDGTLITSASNDSNNEVVESLASPVTSNIHSTEEAIDEQSLKNKASSSISKESSVHLTKETNNEPLTTDPKTSTLFDKETVNVVREPLPQTSIDTTPKEKQTRNRFAVSKTNNIDQSTEDDNNMNNKARILKTKSLDINPLLSKINLPSSITFNSFSVGDKPSDTTQDLNSDLEDSGKVRSNVSTNGITYMNIDEIVPIESNIKPCDDIPTQTDVKNTSHRDKTYLSFINSLQTSFDNNYENVDNIIELPSVDDYIQTQMTNDWSNETNTSSLKSNSSFIKAVKKISNIIDITPKHNKVSSEPNDNKSTIHKSPTSEDGVQSSLELNIVDPNIQPSSEQKTVESNIQSSSEQKTVESNIQSSSEQDNNDHVLGSSVPTTSYHNEIVSKNKDLDLKTFVLYLSNRVDVQGLKIEKIMKENSNKVKEAKKILESYDTTDVDFGISGEVNTFNEHNKKLTESKINLPRGFKQLVNSFVKACKL